MTGPPLLPLDGIKVLDLTRVLAGPWCTMTLADLGAEVIKIEHPVRGDDTRGWSPFTSGGESAYYLFVNRSKQSVAIDIADQKGQKLVQQLAARADILVENFRFEALDKYGLGYDAVRKLNPRIIYCSISGYGRVSPMAARPGYDYVAQAEGGMMAVTGNVDGPPVKAGVPVADLFSGMNATQAILAALLVRDRLGKAQHLDIALLDGQVAALMNVASEYLLTGNPVRRYGNSHPSVVPYQAFEAADGPFVLAVGNDGQFAKFCVEIIDRPDLVTNPYFKTNAARVANRVALGDILQSVLKMRPVAHWLHHLEKAGVPAGKIRSVDEVLQAPEVLARGMVQDITHPVTGSMKLVGSPLKFSETPVRAPFAPPQLGQHTDQVLADVLNLSAVEIAELKHDGIVFG